MHEKDNEAAAGEGEVLQQDIVDECEDKYEHHTSEVDGALPAHAAQDVWSVGPGHYVPDRLSHVASVFHRFVLSSFARRVYFASALLVLENEEDDHGNGEEEREEKRHEEQEDGNPADGKQLGTEEEDGEERQDEDTHAHNDAVLPRLQTRHVTVVEEDAVAIADVGAVEQEEGVLGDVLIGVEEQRHDSRQHARVHRHQPNARSLLRSHTDAAATASEVDEENDGEKVENEGALSRRFRHCRHVGHQTRRSLHGHQVEREQSLEAVSDDARHQVLWSVYLTEQLVRLNDYFHLQTMYAMFVDDCKRKYSNINKTSSIIICRC